MSEMYNRPVELYCYELTPINIYNAEQINNGYDPLRLSYHRYSHYNAILDPYKSSVGVGLGLAGYRPEDFDPSKQVKDAVQMSEQLEIEQMMVEDKMKITDWEATNEVVVEQIARQSYLQFCKENMHKTFKKSSTSTITSTEASGSSSSILSSCDTSPNNDHQQGCSSSNQCERQKSPSYMDYSTPTGNGRRKKRNGRVDLIVTSARSDD
jgi:OTU domain-containing protein 5